MEHPAPGKRVEVCRILLVSVLVGVLVTSASGAAVEDRASRHLEAPARSDLLYASGPITDAPAIAAPNRARIPLAHQRRYRTAAGEVIALGISPFYSFDAAQIQAWRDFIDSLLHGKELQDVFIYLAPPFEVAERCGPNAAACYVDSPVGPEIVSPGEDLDEQLTAEAILAHEYGHHVANRRVNPPWDALDYGTKRWATYVSVCAAVLAGQFFPGDQYGHYRLNPAEGFAEAYRVANQRRLGLVEAPWRIVDERFYPDATATALIEQDVLEPWTAHNTVTYRGRFTRRGPNRHTFSVATGLDGDLAARVRAPRGVRFRVTNAFTTVCGQRTTDFTVRRVKGFGSFTLVVSRP